MEEQFALQPQKKTQSWLSGMRSAFPIVLGYIPVGFAYGVLATKAGLSAFNTILMSVVVFAGSAQFVGVGMIAAGASAVSIVITTFIVNLRHLLMSAAISPYLKGWRPVELAAFAFELTDETFAVHFTQFSEKKPDKSAAFVTNLISQAAWVAGSWLGVVAGGLIQDVRPFGLDYALPAMFIALLVVQIRSRIHLSVAVLSGLLSAVLLLAGLSQWNVMIAAVVGATVGAVVEQWTKN